jgi:electron transport complex protein RnfD
MKSGLGGLRTVEEIRGGPLMGDFGGRGWEWIGNFIGLGGLWLFFRKVIRWQIPLGVMIGLLLPATVMYMVSQSTHPSPLFHWFSGASILCAFFIATDPVSAATSPKGRLIYGIGIGFLIYAIRTWGSYADGVAFAVLLMNMAVPLIDRLTRPRIVGHERAE